MSIKSLRKLSRSQRVAVASELMLAAGLVLYLVAVGATVASGGSVDGLDVLVIVLLFASCLLNLNWQRSEERCRAMDSPMPEGTWWPTWDDGEPVSVSKPFAFDGVEVTGLLLEGGSWHLVGAESVVARIDPGQTLPRAKSNTLPRRSEGGRDGRR